MSDFDDSVTQLFRHPDLAGAGAALRAEWREEEEEWMRAAAQHWAHGRDIHDVTRDLMHRGDTVEAIAAGRSFTGLVTFVGDDVMEVRTATGRVDVRLTVGDRRGPVAPLVLRVIEKARSGGGRPAPAATTMRARLLERESAAQRVVIGSPLLPEEVRGHVGVGRDHVTVRGDSPDTVLPLAWISWVTPARG